MLEGLGCAQFGIQLSEVKGLGSDGLGLRILYLGLISYMR